jgi:hypothetical protein
MCLARIIALPAIPAIRRWKLMAKVINESLVGREAKFQKPINSFR